MWWGDWGWYLERRAKRFDANWLDGPLDGPLDDGAGRCDLVGLKYVVIKLVVIKFVVLKFVVIKLIVIKLVVHKAVRLRPCRRP